MNQGILLEKEDATIELYILLHPSTKKELLCQETERLFLYLIFTKPSVLDTEIKIILFLKFMEDITVGLLIEALSSIENLKTKVVVFKKSIGCSKAISYIEIHPCLTLL